MERIAVFEKVSLGAFCQAYALAHNEGGLEEAGKAYEELRLPERATTGSAGYDFYCPCDLVIKPGQEVMVPTGIRAKISVGYVLMLFPRSSLGFKYRLQLDNTVGIIDSDYYYAENEGHIFCKMINDSREGKTVVIHKGDRFAQGVFLPFGITVDDAADGKRIGGFGSTDK